MFSIQYEVSKLSKTSNLLPKKLLRLKSEKRMNVFGFSASWKVDLYISDRLYLFIPFSKMHHNSSGRFALLLFSHRRKNEVIAPSSEYIQKHQMDDRILHEFKHQFIQPESSVYSTEKQQKLSTSLNYCSRRTFYSWGLRWPAFSLTEHFSLFSWSPAVFSNPSWSHVSFPFIYFLLRTVVYDSTKCILSTE